ncbi:MAG: hypothetical protein WCK35_05030 [Chloroflexota bacterium]
MNTGSAAVNNSRMNSADGQTSAGSGNALTKSKKSKNKKSGEVEPLPVLVELIYTVSVIVVIVATLLVVLTSIFVSASLLDIIIRASVTILVMGVLTLLASWRITTGVIKVGLDVIEEEQRKEEEEEKQKKEEEQRQLLEEEQKQLLEAELAQSIESNPDSLGQKAESTVEAQ